MWTVRGDAVFIVCLTARRTAVAMRRDAKDGVKLRPVLACDKRKGPASGDSMPSHRGTRIRSRDREIRPRDLIRAVTDRKRLTCAQFGEHGFLIVAVTATVEQPGTTSDEATVLILPLDDLDVTRPFSHFFDSWIAAATARCWYSFAPSPRLPEIVTGLATPWMDEIPMATLSAAVHESGSFELADEIESLPRHFRHASSHSRKRSCVPCSTASTCSPSCRPRRALGVQLLAVRLRGVMIVASPLIAPMNVRTSRPRKHTTIARDWRPHGAGRPRSAGSWRRPIPG